VDSASAISTQFRPQNPHITGIVAIQVPIETAGDEIGHLDADAFVGWHE
jgi:hypothetical protein